MTTPPPGLESSWVRPATCAAELHARGDVLKAALSDPSKALQCSAAAVTEDQRRDASIEFLSTQLRQAHDHIEYLDKALRASQTQLLRLMAENALRDAGPKSPCHAAGHSSLPPSAEASTFMECGSNQDDISSTEDSDGWHVAGGLPGPLASPSLEPRWLRVDRHPLPEVAECDDPEDAKSNATPQETDCQKEAEEAAARPPAESLCLEAKVPDIVRSAQRGELAKVCNLLGAGASADSQDEFGVTALHGAAKKGHFAVVARLLQSKADPDTVQSRCKLKPLHYAAKHGHLEVVQALLDARANPNALSDEGGQSARTYAQARGHEAIVHVLCAYENL
eukprot:TRINITY_DN42544_c0_g1_i1.p1 TRINITY_DN42544_c0_g1~~TRINITY_DN42544_c0_g1_i1.p1  ORF type:complete len:337 (-),score=66.50 TRINITY_DN42544_c0_g1_i1:425-1435(-)